MFLTRDAQYLRVTGKEDLHERVLLFYQRSHCALVGIAQVGKGNGMSDPFRARPDRTDDMFLQCGTAGAHETGGDLAAMKGDVHPWKPVVEIFEKLHLRGEALHGDRQVLAAEQV